MDEIVASKQGGQWYNHQYDARGHCLLLTTSTGVIQEQYDYDAFGMPYSYNAAGTSLGNFGGVGNRFLFTGREWLKDLRVYDYRHRHYQPELGRFLQPDPKQFEAGDYNLYRYCHNDPINKSDPTGLVATFRFSDGTKSIAKSAKEFKTIAENATAGSIDAIIVKGHGTNEFQGFNIHDDKSTDGIYYDGQSSPYLTENGLKPIPGGSLDKLLKGKFDPGGQKLLTLAGCDTAAGSNNITRAASTAVPGIRAMGSPGSTHPIPLTPSSGPFANGPYWSWHTDRIYVNGDLQYQSELLGR